MFSANQQIDQLAAKARKAAGVFKTFTQKQVDEITAAMDKASVANEQ